MQQQKKDYESALDTIDKLTEKLESAMAVCALSFFLLSIVIVPTKRCRRQSKITLTSSISCLNILSQQFEGVSTFPMLYFCCILPSLSSCYVVNFPQCSVRFFHNFARLSLSTIIYALFACMLSSVCLLQNSRPYSKSSFTFT